MPAGVYPHTHKRGPNWTVARIESALQAFRARTGRAPTPRDWRRRNGLPSRSTVEQLLGCGFKAALAQLGVVAPTPEGALSPCVPGREAMPGGEELPCVREGHDLFRALPMCSSTEYVYLRCFCGLARTLRTEDWRRLEAARREVSGTHAGVERRVP